MSQGKGKRPMPASQRQRQSSSRTAASSSTGTRKPPPSGPVDANSASKRLFDLRWLIAAMFVVYGVVLIVVGILDNQKEVDKAAGVRINLWAGIGMLLLGLSFAAWARWKPLRAE